MGTLFPLQLFDRAWFASVPASRLALLRIAVSGYALWYLGTRTPMLLEVVADTDSVLFAPIGSMAFLDAPLSPLAFQLLLASTLAFGAAFLVGFRFRLTGPAFAVLLLATLSYRNSWSMIYHSHNIVVLHVFALAFAPAADALSLDAWRRRGGRPAGEVLRGWPYAWPVLLICVLTLTTYWLAGMAKVLGELGFAWGGGEVLRSQIAVDAIRKEVFLKSVPPFAALLYDQLWLFTILGVVSLVVELLAPLALLERRLARLWAVQAFAMHWGIYFLMGIVFRYQLAGLIFLSFFDVERAATWLRSAWARWKGEPEVGAAARPPVVLFDGVCNFCEGAVRFVLKRDRAGRFRFAPLQSATGRELLAGFRFPPDWTEGLVVVDSERVYTRSDAALRVARGLPGAWPLLWALRAVPRTLRDFVYDAFAARRYRWFGERSACFVPTPEIRQRFLE